MAINKKLIHFNEKSEFDKRLANDEILDTSIVFVKDSKEIWTHGNLYKSVSWSVLEKNIIHFVLNGANCEAEEGMTFKEWIFSDYFDINNPYNLMYGSSDNVRDYVTEYGSTNVELLVSAGSFNPNVYIEDVIIANTVYSPTSFDAQ